MPKNEKEVMLSLKVSVYVKKLIDDESNNTGVKKKKLIADLVIKNFGKKKK